MLKIQWPTAVVLSAFVLGWTTLAWTGHPIPAWMAATGAILGKVILSLMPSILPPLPKEGE